MTAKTGGDKPAKKRKGKAEEPETPEAEAAAAAEETVPAEPKAEEPDEEPEKKAKKRKGKEPEDPLQTFLKVAEKKWPDTVNRVDELAVQKLPRLSTGNIGLDIATYGGWPRGRVARAFGKEKSGKTGSLLNTAVEWQKHCALCYERFECHPDCDYAKKKERPKAPVCWIDAENRLIRMWDWVKSHGVDLSRFVIQCPPDGQHIVDFVDAVIREKGAGLGLIVVDSIAHVVSHEEIKKETVDGRTAPVNALLMNKAVRKWTSGILSLGLSETRLPTVLLINQLRQSLDQFSGGEFQPGGLGTNYATSLDVRFSSGKYHYIITNPDGTQEDKCQKFGSKWKPDEHATPDYMECNYRVTASGVCPIGRYGQFNYWLHAAHGRRTGDPDNVDRMWEFSKKYELITQEGRTQKLFDLEAGTQNALKGMFFESPTTQAKVWKTLVERFVTTPA